MPKRMIRALLAWALLMNAPEALAACLPDPPADDDPVVCDGVDSTGYDASGATGLTITTDGTTVLTESNPVLDSAILVSDDNEVTIGADARIEVTEANGFGIRGNDLNTITLEDGAQIDVMQTGGVGIQGNDGNTITLDAGSQINVMQADGFGIRANNDNFVDNAATITIDGDDGRGVSLGENTTGVLPNGIFNRSGNIIANGLRSIALEGGDNSGISNAGTLDVIGDEARGISAGNRTDLDLPADLSNTTSGTINVIGNDAIGIEAGTGWFLGTEVNGMPVPNRFGIVNTGTIDVSGSNSTAIFAGQSSLVATGGTIDVTGTGAVGISLGGNDLFDPFDPAGDPDPSFFDWVNAGTITGDADAGPLAVFRGFVAGRQNRVLNQADGEILATAGNLAILGTAGDELILNFGRIEGNVDLGDGNDRYVEYLGATGDGTIFGGDGVDELFLDERVDNVEPFGTFDVSRLDAFEEIQILNSTGWALSNAGGFDGLVHVAANGRLHVPMPITLGGDFSVDPNGDLEVTVEPATPALTIEGASTFDGTLKLIAGATLTPSPTPYRVILANGGYTGVFQLDGTSGTSRFTTVYDALGLLAFFEQGLVLVAQGDNQRAIAEHLTAVDLAGGASGDLQALIDSFDTSTGNLSITLNSLNPEVYDVHTQILVEGGRRVANLLLDRPRECQPGQRDPWGEIDKQLPCHARSWAPWVAAIGGFRSREKFSNHLRYDSKVGGLVAGIDAHPIEGLDLTFAIGSQRGTLDAAGAGESTVTMTDVSGAAAWTIGPVRTQGVLSWGHGFHDDRRLIRQDQTDYALDSRGNEEHDSDRITIAAEVGVLFDVAQIQIEPLVGLDWAWIYQRPIHESGAGGFGIEIDSRDDSVGSINAGIRLSTTYEHSRYLMPQLEWMDGVWKPSIEVRWRQMLDGDQRDFEARFAGSPDGIADFEISGEEDEGGAEIGIGASFTPKHANRLQFDVRYDAFVAEHTVEHDLVGRVMISF